MASRKVWTCTILSPNTLFCHDIKICRDLLTLGNLRAKKCSFLGQKQCFLGKKCTITWYILHIILSEICIFAITRKNDAFVAKIVNTRLTKILMAIFALAERLPTSATLQVTTTHPSTSKSHGSLPIMQLQGA